MTEASKKTTEQWFLYYIWWSPDCLEVLHLPSSKGKWLRKSRSGYDKIEKVPSDPPEDLDTELKSDVE